MFDAPAADFIRQCAPHTHIDWVLPVTMVESGLNPFAIRVNSGKEPVKQPVSREEAIALATELMIENTDIDVGLGGLRAADLAQHGLTLTEAFEPCANIKATALILQGYYGKATLAGFQGNDALSYMFAAFYGAGDISQGRAAGYDVRVMAQYQAIKDKIPALHITATAKLLPARENSATVPAQVPEQNLHAVSPEAEIPAPLATSTLRPLPSWDVYGASNRSSLLVFSKTGH
jgi:type IV secretion system protein VirB1